MILLYHRVIDKQDDPLGVVVRPRHFEEQMQVLARLGGVAPLAELAEASATGRVAITFDDGYADNLRIAAPILEHYGIPATFFITTGRIGSGRLFWWDELQHLMYRNMGVDTELDLSVGGTRVRGRLTDPPARSSLFDRLLGALKPLPPEEIDAHIEEIRTQVRVTPSHDTYDDLPMTKNELHELAAEQLFEIGCHTVNHPALSQMPPQRRQAEILGSRDQLRDLLGIDASSFAYPFGGTDVVDDTTAEIVRKAGFARACTTQAQRVLRRTNLFMLPRHAVDDWNGREFETRITEWLASGL